MFKTLILLLLLAGLYSCNKITPSGEFWKSFNKNEIDKEEFDHGLYGGKTQISWSKNVDSKFSEQEIIKFAEKNGWRFVDKDDVKNVMNSNEFSYSIINTRLNLDEYKNAKVLRFHTNALTIDEDTQMDTQNNCFAILSENLDSLTIYYIWGDF